MNAVLVRFASTRGPAVHSSNNMEFPLKFSTEDNIIYGNSLERKFWTDPTWSSSKCLKGVSNGAIQSMQTIEISYILSDTTVVSAVTSRLKQTL